MIGYVTLGTNDADKAVAFYDALFAQLEAKKIPVGDRITLWSTGRNTPMLGVARPHDGQAATAGNGTMVALSVGTTEAVDRMHARALELGGADEGAPGARGGNFYGGYFRDLDGNKLVAFCMTG